MNLDFISLHTECFSLSRSEQTVKPSDNCLGPSWLTRKLEKATLFIGQFKDILISSQIFSIQISVVILSEKWADNSYEILRLFVRGFHDFLLYLLVLGEGEPVLHRLIP